MRRALEAAGNRAALALVAVLIAIEAAEAQPKENAVTESSAGRNVVVLVSIPDRRLALIDSGRVVRTFPVAVGTESTPSPTGEFRVVSRLVDPTYYHPGQVVPPGPQNPLGTRWIGLSKKGFGIHGTNAPRSIGKAASHGCIRMAKSDLEQLFTMVRTGDVVMIRGERDAQVAQVFGGAAVLAADAGTAQAPAGN
ncbi:MAG: L,D-transpeptidase [Acidobacteria bacterium]|nr:L,D-transpeptidase [Acidobacteriota bacterium]